MWGLLLGCKSEYMWADALERMWGSEWVCKLENMKGSKWVSHMHWAVTMEFE